MHTGSQRAQALVGARGINVRRGFVQRIRQAVSSFNAGGIAWNIGQQKAGVYQHRFAFGVLLAENRSRGDQAGRESLLHGELRATLGAKLGVECNELKLVADTPPLGHVVAAHLAGIQAALAHRVGDVDAEQKRLFERCLRYFQPDFFVFAPNREQAILSFGLFNDVGKGFGRGRVGCGFRCRSCRCGRRYRRRCASLGCRRCRSWHSAGCSGRRACGGCHGLQAGTCA